KEETQSSRRRKRTEPERALVGILIGHIKINHAIGRLLTGSVDRHQHQTVLPWLEFVDFHAKSNGNDGIPFVNEIVRSNAARASDLRVRIAVENVVSEDHSRRLFGEQQ